MPTKRKASSTDLQEPRRPRGRPPKPDKAKAKAPLAKAKAPLSKAKAPLSKAKAPLSKAKAPPSKPKTPSASTSASDNSEMQPKQGLEHRPPRAQAPQCNGRFSVNTEPTPLTSLDFKNFARQSNRVSRLLADLADFADKPTSPCYIFLSARPTVTACLVTVWSHTPYLPSRFRPISTQEFTMDNNTHHTRAATRAGVFEPPAPLFNVKSLSPVTTEAGSTKVPSTEKSVSAAVPAAARPSYASALGIPSVSHTGDNSSELPSLTRSDTKDNAPSAALAPGVDDGGWTPVTRKTSRSHQEYSSNRNKHTNSNSGSHSGDSDNESESTLAKATQEMSIEDLDALIRRHEAISAQFRAALSAREKASGIDSKKDVKSEKEGDAPDAKDSNLGAAENPHSSPALKSRRATVEEVEDEGDLINFNYVGSSVSQPVAGPSRDKGKGPDPGNWGDVSVLQNFSAADLEAQREMFRNYEEINRMIKQEEISTNLLVDFSPWRTSSPHVTIPRDPSKSPSEKKAAELPKKATRVDEPLVATAPVFAPRVVQAPANPGVVPTTAPAAAPHVVQPPAAPAKPAVVPTVTAAPPVKPAITVNTVPLPPNPARVGFINIGPDQSQANAPVPDLAANNASETKSGLTTESLVELLLSKINELQLGQGVGREVSQARANSPHRDESEAPTRPTHQDESPATAWESHVPRGMTPGRYAAENFFERALHGAPKTPAKGSPEDPSDDSSSDGDLTVRVTPYPGDSGRMPVENRRKHVVVDREILEDLTFESSRLKEPDFTPALWYAQRRAVQYGLDPNAPRSEERYLQEIGDAQVRAVGLLLRSYLDTSENQLELYSDDEGILISDREAATCVLLPWELLIDPEFDIFSWYDEAVLGYCSGDSSYACVDTSEDSEYETCAEHDELPSLQSVSNSSNSGSGTDLRSLSALTDSGSMPDLQSVSDSSSEESASCGDTPPSLISNDAFSEDESDFRDPTRLVRIGDEDETLEDRLKFWAHVPSELPMSARRPEMPPRPHRLGDVLGDTITALLSFFQPYPGDDHLGWTDEREKSRRFRVLRVSEEFYVIEDSWHDWATALPMEGIRTPKFHLVEWYAKTQARNLGIEYPRRCRSTIFLLEKS
ncbi:hypothetical protein B0H12DRAFT_1071064 [Mycena haematopus]|nr:hypothetical protein B0H12DRAFT_1071064 [Mycena haematopus]